MYMFKKEKLKKKVALFALRYIKPNTIIGVGTGSTVSYFIDALSSIKDQIKGVVSSSEISSIQLKNIGIPLYDLNDLHDSLDIYIDSADEVNDLMQMVKGGGAALTKEKIISFASKKFICIVDVTKVVKILGKFPLPIEVIPMARSVVSKELVCFGGFPKYRENVITDNGNIILDVHNLNIVNAIDFEKRLNNIPGIVTVGLFAIRKADILLISSDVGIKVKS
ncbi:MAG: ribose-5-phosphate isomerase A [Candidatus Westeberhardia cardiocondylae]|nr:ribose-5-phosphate isomerase A [Candidatus Westeberhardia cardiocondylae]